MTFGVTSKAQFCLHVSWFYIISPDGVTLSLEIWECLPKYFGRFPMCFKSWYLKGWNFVLYPNFLPFQGLCLTSHLILNPSLSPQYIIKLKSFNVATFPFTSGFLRAPLSLAFSSWTSLWKAQSVLVPLCPYGSFGHFLTLHLPFVSIAPLNPPVATFHLHLPGSLSGIWYSSLPSSKSSLIFKESRECSLSVSTPQGPLLAPSSSHLTFSQGTQWTTAWIVTIPTFRSLAQMLSSNGLLNTFTGKSLWWLNSTCPKLPYIVFLPRNLLFCLYFLLVISSLPVFSSHLRGLPLPHIQLAAKSFWVYLWTL